MSFEKIKMLPEPPTNPSRIEAQTRITCNRKSISSLTDRIQSAERTLAQIVEDSRRNIEELKVERALLENEISLALAYISPIRTLPHELLRHIFMLNFEDHPCCAWGLAAVCTMWRRLVLSMPRLWSKIRLVTTPNASADTIRLWLERSRSNFPLDIEIFLQVQTSSSKGSPHRSASPIRHPLLPPLAAQYAHAAPPMAIHLLTGQASFLLPPSPPLIPSDNLPPLSPMHPSSSPSKSSIHWGHIAFYYLAEQIHRWERFVFRFDKHFTSITALKSVIGDAPLLKEFEVSCAEPAFYPEWSWLPSAKADTTVSLPLLSSLTLQYMPFKWSSPIFKTNLRSLTLRTLPTSHLPLDRVLHIVAANPALKYLDLHVGTVHSAILPLTPLVMAELTELSLGGHYLLSQLADNLTLPAIESITYDIEARDPVEDTIANLISRSDHPPLATLSIAYGVSTTFFYGATGGVMSWNFLLDLIDLKCLKAGGTPLEPLLLVLTRPDEDQHHWYCPKLSHIYLKGCHAHGEGVAKLVHMIDARNPTGGSSHSPVDRLKHLELHECAVLGPDVIQWLKNRVLDVICTEPAFERSPRSPSYGYL